MHCVNLDPAAEAFGYPVSIDVRDLVALEDVMEEMGLGPNGCAICVPLFRGGKGREEGREGGIETAADSFPEL